jgi:hypothetical protein
MRRRMTIVALAAAMAAALTAAAASGAVANGRFGYRSGARLVAPIAAARMFAQTRRRFLGRRPNFGPHRFTPRRFTPHRFSPRNFSPRGYRYNRRPSRGGFLPMRVVASRALACHPGRILDARLQGSTYVFKILTRRGRLVRVYGDARSGAVSCR